MTNSTLTEAELDLRQKALLILLGFYFAAGGGFNDDDDDDFGGGKGIRAMEQVPVPVPSGA